MKIIGERKYVSTTPRESLPMLLGVSKEKQKETAVCHLVWAVALRRLHCVVKHFTYFSRDKKVITVKTAVIDV